MYYIAGYIDPGTGSMLFTILLGLISGFAFFWKKVVLKLKILLSGGRAQAEKEKHEYVIFSDSKRYWNVFKPICDSFEARGIDIEYMTSSPDDPALLTDYRHVHPTFIGEGNRAFAKLNYLEASVLLSTTPGLDVYQWKRSKNVDWYVHIFHAVDEGAGYRMFGMDYYDSILLTGAFQEYYIRKLEDLRNLPHKELVVTGSTYMDALKSKIDKALSSKASGSTTVLLAPSWGESAILSRYGKRIIESLIKTGYNIIVRPHPQTVVSEKGMLDRLTEEFKDVPNLKWNYDNDNFEVLNQADIMITDFSGIIFDFALAFGKPVIYADTSFDASPYDAAWLDEPLWRFEVLKEIGVPLESDKFDDIKEIIDRALADTSYTDARLKVRDEAWQFIGESAERTVDYLIEKHNTVTSEAS